MEHRIQLTNRYTVPSGFSITVKVPQESSFQAYMRIYREGKEKILSTLYNLNWKETPSEKRWKDETGFDQLLFDNYLKDLLRTGDVKKVGRVNKMDYYRISYPGVAWLSTRIRKKLRRLL